jgi:hypothetical protein
MIFAMDEDEFVTDVDSVDEPEGTSSQQRGGNNWLYLLQDDIRDVYYFVQDFLADNYLSFRRRVSYVDFLTFLETHETMTVPRHFHPKPVVQELFQLLDRRFQVVSKHFRKEAFEFWLDRNI